jgi:flagellar basal-body rod protein FlgG
MTSDRQKELTMKGMRNSSFVVSLVLIALIVCSAAIQRQFARSTRSSISLVDFDDAGMMLSDSGFSKIPLDEIPDTTSGSITSSQKQSSFFAPFTDSRQADASGIRRCCGQAPSSSDIISALQVQNDEAQVPTVRASDPPTAVPAPVDAVPVETPEREKRDDDERENDAVRTVIERELSHTSREERDIWFDELKALPAGVVRDLLQVRKQIRAMPRLTGENLEKLASADPIRDSNTRGIVADPVSQKIRYKLPDETSANVAINTAISQLRHNLTNSTTPGFKRLRVTLVDCYSSASTESVASNEAVPNSWLGSGIHGEGCRLAPMQLDLKQGALKNTGRQLDLAIDGEGFFVVKRGKMELLTRCGAFTLDRDRQLCLAVTDDHVLLQPTITVPDDVREIQVAADGTVTILKSTEVPLTIIGRLHLARVASPGRLQPIGQTLLMANDDSGPIVVGPAMQHGTGEIQQGALEQSNVDFQTELDEIESLMQIIKDMPYEQSRPVTATGPQRSPAR